MAADQGPAGSRASVAHVSATLRKVLPDASLQRIPRHPERRDILLAVLCLGLRRRYPYSETELGDYLQAALARLNAKVDHVTCRRYMVDLGFLRRDRAGTRYFVNYPKVEATLSEEAMAEASRLIGEVTGPERHTPPV